MPMLCYNVHMPNTKFESTIFLKLGGSLITDKASLRTARLDTLDRLIAEFKKEMGNLRLVLGHGSGSFAHVPAQKHATRQGVNSHEGWQGFAEVWHEAALLNRLVVDALHAAGIPGISFPASGGVTAKNSQVAAWNLDPLNAALDAKLLPVVYGDVVFDQTLGGTIFSTEDIFTHLAQQLRPQRILLAGVDEGVWADFPTCKRMIPEITPENWNEVAPSLGGSAATDVTGGMFSKVQEMLALVEEFPGLVVQIFSGNQPGNLAAALRGEILGTRISDKNRRDC